MAVASPHHAALDPVGQEPTQDRVTFDVLYEQHVSSVYRYALSRLRDPQMAEDIASEVFLRAWRGFEQYRGGTPAAWLIVIARRVVADTTRGRRSVVSLDLATDLMDRADRPDEAALASDTREALRAAVARLSDEQRAVVDLQLAGWSGPEIAEALGKSQAAVRMLRRRALQRLRDLLATDEGGSDD